ncbi:hypothetical protein BGZ97_009791, partial [Linnemannia gamsii]
SSMVLDRLWFWGCMTWDGPGFLAKIDSTLDSSRYIRTLKDELVKTINRYIIGP